MAIYFTEPSRTFSDFCWYPGYSSKQCMVDKRKPENTRC